MSTVVVKTQAEYDALPASFDVFTTIEIRSSADIWLRINRVPAVSPPRLPPPPVGSTPADDEALDAEGHEAGAGGPY